MREILDFFKDIFMIKKESRLNIGLSQFKSRTPLNENVSSVPKRSKELKLSELMRGSAN